MNATERVSTAIHRAVFLFTGPPTHHLAIGGIYAGHFFLNELALDFAPEGDSGSVRLFVNDLPQHYMDVDYRVLRLRPFRFGLPILIRQGDTARLEIRALIRKSGEATLTLYGDIVRQVSHAKPSPYQIGLMRVGQPLPEWLP